MIVRISTWVVRLVLGLLLVVILALAAAGFRLAAGPVDLGPAGPWIADRLELAEGRFRIDAGEARLSLDATNVALTLAVEDVRIIDRFNQPVLRLPGLRIGLSVGDLIAQRIAPTVLEVTGVELAVQRAPSGEVSLALLDAAPLERARAPEDGLPVSRLMPLFEPGAPPPEPKAPDHELRAPDPAAPPIPAEPASDVDRLRGWLNQMTDPGAWALDMTRVQLVRVAAVDVTYQDGVAGFSGQISGRDLRLIREGERIRVAVDLAGNVAGEAVGASLGGLVTPDQGAADLDLTIHPTRVDRIAAVLGLPAPFDGLALPLQGVVEMKMADRRIDRLRLHATAGAGEVDWPGVIARPLPVERVVLAADLTEDGNRLEVTRADLRLADGAALGGSVTVTGLNGPAAGLGISGGVIGGDLAVDDIDRYWPLGQQEAARDWVISRVRGGRVDGVSVVLDIRPGMLGADGHLAPSAIQGDFAYRGISVDYERPLPPARDLAGTGSFDLRGLRFNLKDGGRAGDTGLRLGAARVAIEGFGVKTEPTRVESMIPISGPVADAVRVLAMPPIEFVDPALSNPDGLEGRTDIDLTLKLPLGQDKPDVRYTARGRIEALALRKAVLGLDMADGSFAVAVDNAQARLTGRAAIGGAPLDIDWRQAIAARTEWERRVDVAGTLDEAARKRAGFDLAPYLTGPIGLKLAVEVPRGKPDEPVIQVDADLARSRLAIPDIGWTKPAGTAGQLTATVHPHAVPGGAGPGGEVIDIRDLRIEAGDLYSLGTLRVAAGRLLEAKITRLDLGDSRLRIDYRAGRDGAADRVSLAGRMLDVEPLIDRKGGETAAEVRDPAAPPKRIDLELALDRVRIDDERHLDRARGSVSIANGHWREARLQAVLPVAPETAAAAGNRGPGMVSVAIGGGAAAVGGRTIRLETDRMDDLIAFAGLRGRIAGGSMVIDGVIDDSVAHDLIRGHVVGRDYRLQNAPAIARALATASPAGVSDQLGGRDGIAFSVLDGDFVYEDGVVTLAEARAHGSEVGVTASGQIDIDGGTIDMAGTLVPLYTLNSAIGRIPVIGDLLVGEEGSGIFAATYRLKGPLDDPDVSVNPLAALAPGFLRNLFGAIADGVTGKAGSPPTGTDPKPDFNR
ncbi:AsmA-like C-terminal domain-containing protein [Tistrella mobilis]|uniref:YhdP family protein n=1 Tax=Tistrella mobilis TaxID=171437 RepID=UPI0035568437